jgi:hypothetical protein
MINISFLEDIYFPPEPSLLSTLLLLLQLTELQIVMSKVEEYWFRLNELHPLCQISESIAENIIQLNILCLVFIQLI